MMSRLFRNLYSSGGKRGRGEKFGDVPNKGEYSQWCRIAYFLWVHNFKCTQFQEPPNIAMSKLWQPKYQ
ncbi:unnamed protein product [Calypogeia fissa]